MLYYHHGIKMTQQIQNHNAGTLKHSSPATAWQGPRHTTGFACFMLGIYRVAKRESGSGLKEAFGR